MEKNLQQEDAIKKFKKLAQEVNICMFITNTNEEKEHTRPMATIDVDDDGTLWFYTDIRSIKVEEVTMDKQVHLTYAHPGKESYMDVWGTSSIVTDRALIKEKWSPVVKAYFPGGADDPNVALMKVRPTSVYYWESETGKMVSS
jgi:general stress protein 26